MLDQPRQADARLHEGWVDVDRAAIQPFRGLVRLVFLGKIGPEATRFPRGLGSYGLIDREAERLGIGAAIEQQPRVVGKDARGVSQVSGRVAVPAGGQEIRGDGVVPRADAFAVLGSHGSIRHDNNGAIRCGAPRPLQALEYFFRTASRQGETLTRREQLVEQTAGERQVPVERGVAGQLPVVR